MSALCSVSQRNTTAGCVTSWGRRGFGFSGRMSFQLLGCSLSTTTTHFLSPINGLNNAFLGLCPGYICLVTNPSQTTSHSPIPHMPVIHIKLSPGLYIVDFSKFLVDLNLPGSELNFLRGVQLSDRELATCGYLRIPKAMNLICSTEALGCVGSVGGVPPWYVQSPGFDPGTV